MDKNSLVKKLLPHAVAIFGMLIILMIYFAPAMKGLVMEQHDLIRGKAMKHEIVEFREETGEEALWTNSMFGGMPAYQISAEHPGNWFGKINSFLQFGLPSPVGLFFLIYLGFYLLLCSLKINPWLSAGLAAAYLFSSYFFIAFEAGHATKILAIAYMAPILAGILTVYRGRYLLGGAITAFFVALEVTANHVQITYYLFLALIILFIILLIRSIRQQKIKEFATGTIVLLLAGALGIGPNLSMLWTTYEYSEETIRGGSELKETQTLEETSEKGLSKSYVFRWSYGIDETLTLLIPNFMGGSNQQKISKDSNVGEFLRKQGVPTQQRDNIIKNAPMYWGDQPFTSGPVYVGAAVCFLFVLGMLVIKGPYKWWLVLATAISIILAWGGNFSFNYFMYDYFPLYNKFRAPAMALVIAELTMPLLAALALWHIVRTDKLKERESYLKPLYIAGGITGGLCLLMALLGPMMMSFTGEGDAAKSLASNNPQFYQAILEDRASLLRLDAFRSLFFILASGGIIWAFIQNKVNKKAVLGVVGFLMLADLAPVCYRYLDADSFVRPQQFEANFTPAKVDQLILQDPDPNYRVIDLQTDPFTDAATSYYHKNIGGYHAAKLQRYQELYEILLYPELNQFKQNLQNVRSDSALQQVLGNLRYFNMLNTKYFILSDENPPLMNPMANGNAWFVNEVKWAQSPDEEIKILSQINPRQTAVIDERFKATFEAPAAGAPSGTIKLTSYAPNHLVYESQTDKNQVAVFSEIYYNSGKGWQAYIDDEPVEHFRADYVLRGMTVPAGKHQIEFRFEPTSYYTGNTIAMISSLIVLLLLIGGGYWRYRKISAGKDTPEATPVIDTPDVVDEAPMAEQQDSGKDQQ